MTLSIFLFLGAHAPSRILFGAPSRMRSPIQIGAR